MKQYTSLVVVTVAELLAKHETNQFVGGQSNTCQGSYDEASSQFAKDNGVPDAQCRSNGSRSKANLTEILEGTHASSAMLGVGLVDVENNFLVDLGHGNISALVRSSSIGEFTNPRTEQEDSLVGRDREDCPFEVVEFITGLLEGGVLA